MRSVDWKVVVDRWALIVADFHRLLNIDLEAVYWDRSWHWFEMRVSLLLSLPDSLLGRSLDDRKDDRPDVVPDVGEGLAA